MTTVTSELEILDLPVASILPSPFNPRRQLDAEAVERLAGSIADVGLLQPLVVRPVDGDQYELVAGHQRLAALQQIGADTAPCVVRRDIDGELAVIVAALIENGDRADLDPVDEGRAYKRLAELGMNQRSIAETVHRSQGHVSKRIALTALPEPAQAAVAARKVTVADAEGLAKIEDFAVVESIVSIDDDRRRGEAIERALRDQEKAEKIAKAKALIKKHGAKLITNTWNGNWTRLDGPEGATGATYDEYSDTVTWYAVDERRKAEREKLEKTRTAQDRKRAKEAKAHEQRQAQWTEVRERHAGHIRSVLDGPRFDSKAALAHIAGFVVDIAVQMMNPEPMPKQACELLGLEVDTTDDWSEDWSRELRRFAAEGGVKRVKASLALVLGDVDHSLDLVSQWRRDPLTVVELAHYRFLSATGYEPTEFELELLAKFKPEAPADDDESTTTDSDGISAGADED